MCYIEYIGYHCGHTSVAVLRVCPLTTHLPTNPVCPRSAHRPTQVTGLCPACARVLHTRWVDLVMFEHQWMHERGTCGCPVRFPLSQHPRSVGPDSSPNNEPGSRGRDATLQAISARMGEAVRGMTAGEAPDGAAPRTPVSLLHERATTSWDSIVPLWEMGESAEVRVRLSSQYAAEWVLDHGKRHRHGDCACPVRFEQYTPHRVTEEDVAAHEKSKPRQRAKKGKNRNRAKYKTSETAKTGPPSSHLMSETLRLSDIMVWNVIERSASPTPWSAWPTRPEDYGFKTVAEAENALWGEGPVVPRPSRLAGKAVSPALFHQGKPPIVGWPIGAGPENGVENSHSPAWHMCDLSRPRLRRAHSAEW